VQIARAGRVCLAVFQPARGRRQVVFGQPQADAQAFEGGVQRGDNGVLGGGFLGFGQRCARAR